MSKTTAAILIALSLGIYFTFTMPQREALAELSNKHREYRNVLGNASSITELRDNLLAGFQTLSATEKDRLEKILPKEQDAVGLSRDLDTIAAQYGIAIKTVAVENNSDPESRLIVLPEAEQPFERTVFSFSFISNYPNFVKFLGDLERNLRVMDVKSMAFRTGETGLYEHQITIETYNLRGLESPAGASFGADLLQIRDKLSEANLNKEIFAEPNYRRLTDFSLPIPDQPIGRKNPFDAIGRE